MTIKAELMLWKFPALLVAIFFLAACSRQDDTDAPAYTTPAAPSGAAPLISIDEQGRIAPFGMASRQAVAIAESGVGPEVVAAAADSAGAALYAVQCSACHGTDAQGVQGLGASLVESSLVGESSEAQLVGFLQVGRMTDSPENTSGIPMPSFSWMPDSDIRAVAEYLKSLP